MSNPVEIWKAEKHGLDVWPDVERYARARTPMKDIETADLERMKWHGVFYRKRDAPGTYMLRIRLTGCELSSRQAKEVAYVAYEYGYGIVDITTRANLQVQGLPIEHVPQALARLTAAGLSARQTGHDNVRNVFGHPFSGVDADELFDTRPLCRQITELFLDSRVYSDLPRKFNIALNGRAEHAAHYWSQDLSFLATRSMEHEVLFQVLVGGTQGQNPRLASHLPVLVRPEQVLDVTRALLDLFREQGSREKRDRARFRYLLDDIGVGGVLDWLEARLPYPLQPGPAEPPPPVSYDELIGWFLQRQDKLWTMGLCVPLGRLTWRQLEAVALAARKWGDGNLRTTHEQGLAILNIPYGFKDAAATDVAACGLSLHGDSLLRNTVACTGKQFCNIAVTETKGQMLKLIERLRERALMLHGIRIHMSGCPSSCAQHFTADVGLKGVRVRRLLGTREGFDVYLGGGISGQVHLALPYKLGVDAGQLPQLIEEVVHEFYQKHRSGQTFSAYWRETLRNRQAANVGDSDYVAPTWLCEGCGYRHQAEDSPVFCPKCAGLRRLFARLEEGGDKAAYVLGGISAAQDLAVTTVGTDSFQFAARDADLSAGAGLAVEVAGREYALFRVGDRVCAIDNACPHEGGPLAQGDVVGDVVSCPWHGWTFSACRGCSLEPSGNDVRRYETKVEDGNIYIKAAAVAAEKASVAAAAGHSRVAAAPKTAALTLRAVVQETPDTKTFQFDNSAGAIPPHRPGQFVRVCVPIDERHVWRSFTISSSPSRSQVLDLTVKRNPAGEVSNYLHDALAVGRQLTVKGPQGGFYFDPERHSEPLALVSAGSGVTPMMSMLRFLADTGSTVPCTCLHGARTAADIIFAEECCRLADSLPWLNYVVSLTEPPEGWTGPTGRINLERVREFVGDVTAARYFLCGPGDFLDVLGQGLRAAGVPPERIHTEQFQATGPMAAGKAS